MINTLFKFKNKQKKKLGGLFGTFFCFKNTLSKIAVDFPLIKIAFLRDYYMHFIIGNLVSRIFLKYTL